MAKLFLDERRLFLHLDKMPEDPENVDFYMILHQGFGSKLHSYDITPKGLDLTPVADWIVNHNFKEFGRYARTLEVVNYVMPSPSPMVYVAKSGLNDVFHVEKLEIDHNLLRPFMDHISVLQSPDDSICQYSYDKIGDVAAFTHVYNEGDMLFVWERYYKRQFGEANVFIIDHGSNDGSIEKLPNQRNVITLPHGKLDHWNMSAFCGYFQRFLLTQYKKVIHTDCDEFLVAKDDPDALKERILATPDHRLCVPELAYELFHDPANEPAIDFSRPITSQRTHLKSNIHFIKPAITSRGATWTPGFHSSFEKDHFPVEDVWMIHARNIDFEDCHRKDNNWGGLVQSDVDKVMYRNDRTPKDELMKVFEENLAKCDARVPTWLDGVF